MNIPSEQLTKDNTLVMAPDQPLTKNTLRCAVQNHLNPSQCSIESLHEKDVLCYHCLDGHIHVLLLSAITYMGGNGQHPSYLKRIQLKPWYKEFVLLVENNPLYQVHFLGVYHYEDTLIFTDVIKDSYMKRKMNNSAAHIYINDFYQAALLGQFQRIDQNGNRLVSIRPDQLEDYLNGKNKDSSNELFQQFRSFHHNFPFHQWITAKEAITQMYASSWSKWKETEWAGWYLEYLFSTYLDTKNIPYIQYTASSNKTVGALDFDLSFYGDAFFGDLKATDIHKKESPGNDKENVLRCIHEKGRLWYIIYEHETRKDRDMPQNNYEATRFRTNFIREKGEWNPMKKWDELSYSSRMKHSVNFKKMYIIELNPVNYRSALTDFHQGKQPDGQPRKPKFNINKRNIENLIVFQSE